MPVEIKSPRKLIEVALPLDAINVAAAREKSIRHGHPSTLHLWWARRPLAAARAVLFAQLVNDPGYERHLGRGMNQEKAKIERERLFTIIEDLVKWENTNNTTVLEAARAEIWKSWRETCELNKKHPQAAELFNPDKLPAFHDPFAGGGSIPLEAQRLGLEAWASDLNPVAVIINKAMIEIPPKFAGRAPIGPATQGGKTERLPSQWTGASGLAEDVRRYGAWMRAEAQKRIGHLYPQVDITQEMVVERPDLKAYHGQKLTVIAWLWARTVKSPNPAFNHVDVPLAASFVLSSKTGKEAYVQAVIEGDSYRFTVKAGTQPEGAKNGTKAEGRGANFLCLLSGSPITGVYIKAEGQAKRLGSRLMAIVAEGTQGRVYLAPTAEHEQIARQAEPQWKPVGDVPARLTGGTCVPYGLATWADLFTPRQLTALTTFSDLVGEAIAKCHADAVKAGLPDDGKGLDIGGLGAQAYAEAVGVYLALALSRLTDICNALCRWEVSKTQVRNLFGRQAIPMIWDYAENNIFANAAGDYAVSLSNLIKALLALPANNQSYAIQDDAKLQQTSANKIVSTDPPYYDNIGYADLSDFFYVWIRGVLYRILRSCCDTLAAPKSDELVATPYRHGTKKAAENFFLTGMKKAISNLASLANEAFPVTIYYAFKQTETRTNIDTASTGWETFLEAVLQSGFAITGTWPMRTELENRMIGSGTNALASSIVLACRKRDPNAPSISRREFVRELNATLPEALLDMTRGGVNSPVAPVDLSQAIIGPGMAVFSKYSAVLEADGNPMSVRTALTLINRFFAEDDFDHDTQFCLQWFDQVGWDNGKYGDADVLARAKGTSVGGLVEAGVAQSSGGSLRLYRWAEMPRDWDPAKDKRLPVWEGLHQMIRALNQESEAAAGKLLAHMAAQTEAIRSLAYRLYTLCERKGWAEDARAYNELITSWPAVEQTMQNATPHQTQLRLDI